MGRKGLENSGTPSNNLWVGNLNENVSDSDLMNLFSKHGHVDSITSYPSRSYAFVYYRRVEDAKLALKALGGTVFRGKTLKIEFAKPAKPCKSLWVSGISQTVTKEMLEEEFTKFGKIEEFKFTRDRNTAYVDYVRLEDAVKALKNLKGKQFGGDEIRVDFLRSQPTRKDQLADHLDAREGQFLNQGTGQVNAPLMRHDPLRNYYEPTHSGLQGQQFHPFGRQRVDGPPTNVLLICYPTNAKIDERMLHNAMILFGEIEDLKAFPARHCAFVKFRSMDEARRAKEGLQGRLFNDPRILIVYSNNEHAPGNNYPELYPGPRGPRPNTYNELPGQPAHMDLPNAPNAFSRYSPSGPMRPFGPPGSYVGTEFKDLSRPHNLQDVSGKGILGAPSWRRTSPAPGVLSSPSPGMKRHGSAPWDVLDDQVPGEYKRSRIDATFPISSNPFRPTKTDDHDLDLDALYRRGSRASQDVHTGGTSQDSLDKDYIWRGLIAKGGNPVCRARCVPIGEGIDSEIPEVVNCSARTGLDLLTKHYADASGFDIVFFLPDCEDDFASYTEFLNYLGGKDRAGVAKFDDGTTLFLVPPSDFLTKVLKIAGPPRLYGVVLKFPQDDPDNKPSHPQSFTTSHYVDGQRGLYQGEYSGFAGNKENALVVDYGKTVTSSHPTPPASALKITTQPVSSVSQAEVALTPDLIATLTSLLPASSSSMRHSSVAGYESDVRPPQDWTPDRQDPNQTAHHSQQAQEQYDPQQQVGQYQNYNTGLNMPYNPVHGASAKGHVQDSPYYQPQPGGVSRAPSSFGINSQVEKHEMSSQFNRHYPNEVAQNALYGFGVGQGNSSLGSYGSSVYPHVSRSDTFPSSAHGNNTQQAQIPMLAPAGRENPELVNKVQQLHTVDGGTSQGTAGVEVDKNQRYQSTLEFAANLLLQIQQRQQQQQPGSGLGQGSANNN